MQYLELLHLLLLLGLPLPDDAEHLAHHRLDPLRERLREGLPEEESVEDGLAPANLGSLLVEKGEAR